MRKEYLKGQTAFMVTANAVHISLLEVLHDPYYLCFVANRAAKKGLPVQWEKIDVNANRFECPVMERVQTLSVDYVSKSIDRLARAAARSFRLGKGNGRFKLVAKIIGNGDLLIPNDADLINEIRLWLADTIINDLIPEFEPKDKGIKIRENPARRLWYISVPPGLSETGKRQRLYFATKDLAVAERERLLLQSEQDAHKLDGKDCLEGRPLEAYIRQLRAISEPGTKSLSEAVQAWVTDIQANAPEDYRGLCCLDPVRNDPEVAQLVARTDGAGEELSSDRSQSAQKELIKRLQKSFTTAMKKDGIDIKRVGKRLIFRAAAVIAVTFFMCGLIFEGPRIGKEHVGADQSLSELAVKTGAGLEKRAGTVLFSKQCEVNDVFKERNYTLMLSKQCKSSDNNVLPAGALPLWSKGETFLIASKQCQTFHLNTSRLNPFVSPSEPSSLC